MRKIKWSLHWMREINRHEIRKKKKWIIYLKITFSLYLSSPMFFLLNQRRKKIVSSYDFLYTSRFSPIILLNRMLKTSLSDRSTLFLTSIISKLIPQKYNTNRLTDEIIKETKNQLNLSSWFIYSGTQCIAVIVNSRITRIQL